MSLVAYPDSESGEEDQSGAALAQPAQPGAASKSASKRKHSGEHDLPPLPPTFHDLYSTNARVSTGDNPSLHGGRKRAVPHMQGNWPSHVYLEWLPSETESTQLHTLITHVKDSLELQNATRAKQLPIPDIVPSLQSGLGTPLPLHVSLSRTLQIKTEDRNAFLETLEQSLRRTAVRTFHYAFHSLKWVPNFERNRWFLVLNIKKPPQDELNRLLNACNQAAQKCGHSALYTGGQGDGPMESDKTSKSTKGKASFQDDRSAYFHVSIAWNLSEPAPEWVSLVQDIDVSKFIQSPEAAIDVVKVKIGNVVTSIALGVKRPGLGNSGSLMGLV
ncbi:hypothetical protein T440DRAFT_507847 [Plenodomus tracheiphilus IPT5]|uniref:U6 snRNA phosphodiesterase n=1 Tax=Plenodomus tracheiphilus IPT5 TaxID=1408161 RepID=A0A6A7B5T3_9PLEO|nr:hypothetical protein T440DRAFT_507847 [Plenodomus tracheiphilus IPT5]